MVATELTYRLYEPRDIEGVLQLWEKHSGWGAITHKQFEDWYLNTPYGPCINIIAQNEEEEIVGQIVFFPAILYINGREVKACRGSAPILNPDYRHPKLNQAKHPALLMIKHGMEAGQQMGFEVLYSFPAQGWATLLKSFPRFGLQEMHVSLYDCFSVSITDRIVATANETMVDLRHQEFGEEYDMLWEEAVQQFPIKCSIKRDAKWLRWKLAGRAVIEVRDIKTGALTGYVAINKKSGLIVDILARNPQDSQIVLSSAIHWLQSAGREKYNLHFDKLTGMLTDSMKATLQFIPFQKENFTFAFNSTFLQDPSLFESLSPANWYMMPND